MTTNVPPEALEVIRVLRKNGIQKNPTLINKLIKKNPSCIPYIFNIALECGQVGRFSEAIFIFKDLQCYAPEDVRIPYNLGLLHTMIGDDIGALSYYKTALAIDPNNSDAMVNIGSIEIQRSNYRDALEILDNALALKKDLPEAWSNKGIALNNLSRFEDAIGAYDQATFYDSNFPEAWSNRALPLIRAGRFSEALLTCDKALSLKPDYAEAWSNKAVTLNELKRYEEALFHYDKALSLKPDYAEAWSNKAVTLNELKRYEEALFHYDKALSLKPDYAEAWSNKGVTLSELGLYGDAISHLDKALGIAPNLAEAWLNMGVALKELKRYEEALFHYDKALSLKADYAEAYSNRASALAELGRYDEALENYQAGLNLKPELDWVHGDFLHLKMKVCQWKNFHEDVQAISNKVMAGKKTIQPFSLLALVDDPLLHQKCAEIYIKEKYPLNPSLGPIEKHQKRAKIRIGYFSADYWNHATGYLTAQLFELHDRNQFEIYAFSFGPDDQSPMRKRLVQAFDHFIEVGNKSDREIAELSRNLGISIAVDLKGYTKDARPGIFALRAAPIQVSYLGYPGTLGANYFEYLIADRVVVPEESQKYYAEKIVYLPQCYQVNDSVRNISELKFSRSNFGIAEESFVFCCFNSGYKILPASFDIWLKILSSVQNSVLWIFNSNSISTSNMRKLAELSGVHSRRLIFADSLASADHLARHQLADLFLDTYPYNAHTTASDALWAGLPVVTLQGKSFASRVASSLLNAINLPELIATTQIEYEDLAIKLANHPEKLAEIKRRLAQSRTTDPLFNTPLFTKNIESAYIEMMRRYWGELKPDHIYL